MAVRVRSYVRRPPGSGPARRREPRFDFITALQEAQDRTLDDLAARIERADACVALATDAAAHGVAVAEARRLRLALLGQRARAVAAHSPADLALALDSYAKTSELSVWQLDELIAAVDAADSSIEQET